MVGKPALIPKRTRWGRKRKQLIEQAAERLLARYIREQGHTTLALWGGPGGSTEGGPEHPAPEKADGEKEG